jgi:fibronectin-binding autotransporter adhesin
MALDSFRWRRILRASISTIIGCGCIGAVGGLGLSALLNWDPSGDPATPGGTGTWDYTTSLWDDNGTLPNVPWSDVTGANTAVFSGTGSLVHLGAPITAGGLTFNSTGYTIDNNGSALNTLTLVTPTTTAPIITNNAANVTTTISASILGNDGLQITATGTLTGTTTKLTGDNKFIGGLTINSGTVELGNAGALNKSVPNNLTFGSILTTSAALRLLGNSVAVRDLTGTFNTSSISNGLAATNAILTVYQQNDQVVKTVLSDGAGTLELVKDGPATLTLGSDNSFTGATTVRGTPLGGTLELAGNNVGRLTGTTSINLSDGGTLRLTNSSTANNGDRIPNAAPINMRGGTLAFSNNATAANFAETGGAVNALVGTNNIFADQAAIGQTSILTLASLTRSQGAVVTFQSNFQGSLVPAQIGVDSRDQIVFTAAPANNDGILVTATGAGGWALFDTSDFATYNVTTIPSVKMVTYAALNLDQASWTTTTNVKYDTSGTITLSDPTFTGFRVVNSLNLGADPLTLQISGLTLTIDAGGIIHQTSGYFGGSIDGGFLTAGTAAGADLVLTVPNPLGRLDVTASIVNNGVGQVNQVNLVKAGGGMLTLSAPNAYTGSTSVVGGTLEIANDSYLGTFPASNTNTLKLYDGTLFVSNLSSAIIDLDARRAIEVGGNSFISVAAGSSGNGRTLRYLLGNISSLPGTEGSLTFLSNANELPEGAVPGTINITLNAALNLGGSLRIDAAAQFRPSQSFANSIGRSLQIGTNGTATFSQTGNTLSVGSGVDDTLDIGLKDLATFSSVAKIGTLTLTGVTQFTAKVDKMRIGVQMQSSESVANSASGTVTLSTNNDISAGSSITISDNENPSGSTLTTSSLTFGAGLNNVTTQSFLLGGRKGTGTVSVLAGGTLNLKGSAERTLNLSIGRNDSTSGSIFSTGTFTTTNANVVFTGSFDNLVIGQKTGSTLIGGATGTLALGSSANNSVVANNLKLGVDTTYNGTANALATAFGTFTMAGGTVTVYNDVALGTQANLGTARGALNVNGGTFNVGGDITKTNSDRSYGVVTVSAGTLNMRNPLVGDATSGTINASLLNFTGGSITNTAALNLDGRSVTDGLTFGPQADALVIRDVSLAAQLNLTGTSANNGGVHYSAAGNGTGATLASVSLGSVARTFNIENSTSTAADFTVTGAVTGAGLLTKSGTGTLLVNGPVAGSATVIAGALGGTGNIAGSVNVGTSGTLTPGGNSIGTLATGPLTFAANATLALDINFTARTTDKTTINGALSLDGSNTTVLSITDLQPIAQFTSFNLQFLDYSTTWNGGLFTVGGVVIDDFDATTNFNSTAFFVGPNRYKIDYNFNGGHVALLSVPEPGSLALIAGGVALLGGMRRRRR